MKKIIFFWVLVTCLSSCNLDRVDPYSSASFRNYFNDANQGVLTGGVKMIPVTTPAGTFHVWTKSFGNNPAMKILLLHGGPGCTHEYFECLESFLPREGIEFIYYDQLGSAYSDQPNDTSLWQLDRFVDELEQVRQALRLNKNNFFLMGHSWGGILAMEYALKYQKHLKGLIISNMMASCAEYGKYADQVLARQMDPTVLDSLRLLEKKGMTGNPLYMNLLIPNFYEQHICRMPADRWPEPLKRCFNKINQQVYTIMQGPSEFGIAGRLTNWDRSQELKNIAVPTLVVGARYDTMNPDYMKWMAGQFPKGSYLYCDQGSHLCMYDDQQTYMNGLIKFLKNQY